MSRPFWGLVAIGAATAVGLTTHDAGFVVITFFGSLWVPRLLGLRGRHGWMGACGGRNWEHRGGGRLEARLGEWHRQAHSGGAGTGSPQDTAPVA